MFHCFRDNYVVLIWLGLLCNFFSGDDLIGTYCDNDVIGEVYSSTRKMYLHFLSDGNTTGRGFQISYEYVCKYIGLKRKARFHHDMIILRY